MKRFRLSEILFLMFGIILMVSAMALLNYDISLVKMFNLHLSPGDPFQASYYTAPASAPEVAATPASTPTPVLPESSKPSLYLTSPANLAVIMRAKAPKTPQMIQFKFELYPKDTVSTFELLFKDKVVKETALPGNETGIHEVSIPIPERGLYQWRVKAPELTSELRTVILKD